MLEKDPGFISVVIPTYHRNDLLQKCLSCLAPDVQTLPNDRYEVIVTDDGSKSTAKQMIEEQFPWAQWVAGPRHGPAANRNNGAQHSRGEWLAFTDDDCLPKPDWLSAMTAAFEVDLQVYEGKTVCEIGIRSPLETAPINETGGWLWSCNMVISKTAFKEIGGFDESFPSPHLEDVDFRERLKDADLKFKWVPEAIIDHPPRKALWGKRSTAHAESEVMFWYKMGNRKRCAPVLIYRTIGGRLRHLRRFRFGRDSLSAIASLIVEITFILRKIGGWERKYRRAYPGPAKPKSYF